MKASWMMPAMLCAAFGLSTIPANAAPITFYDYEYNVAGKPEFGPNIGDAYENHNWGQVERYSHYAGPTGGTVGDSPAAWSIWQLNAPTGQTINSFTVETNAASQKPGEAATNDDHVRIEWSESPNGPWTEIYHHTWDASEYVTASGTVTLSSPLTTAYVRIAADKVDSSHYWVGPVGDQQSTNLLFRNFIVTGDVNPIPEPSSMLLWGSAGMGWFLTMRRH